MVYPTIEELTERCKQLRAKAITEYTAAQKIIMDAVLLNKFVKLSDYQAKDVKNCLLKLKTATDGFDPKTYPQSIFKSAYSFRFMDPNFYDLVKENYWLTTIKEIFVDM
jgi:hypothetical protein